MLCLRRLLTRILRSESLILIGHVGVVMIICIGREEMSCIDIDCNCSIILGRRRETLYPDLLGLSEARMQDQCVQHLKLYQKFLHPPLMAVLALLRLRKYHVKLLGHCCLSAQLTFLSRIRA
jgi:hypothetical protein